VAARAAAHSYPRLALQLQLCCRSPETEARFAQASRWDLVIVDSETVESMTAHLGPDGFIRRANPQTILLAYFSPADFVENLDLPLYRRFRAEFDPSWLVRDVQGRPVPLFELYPGFWTRLINPTTAANRFIPEFLNRNVLASGLLDGIFYDWAATSMSWLNHRKNVDAGRTDIYSRGIGDSDHALDGAWRRGYDTMLGNSRRVFPAGTLIVGNAGWTTGSGYEHLLNGVMIEQFLEGEAQSPDFGWTAVMRTYAHYAGAAVAPRLSIVMANRDDPVDLEFMRFALASTLMFDGYFAFTNRLAPTMAYQTTRWYDEYGVDRISGKAGADPAFKGYLGRPVGAAIAVGTGIRLAEVLAQGRRAEDDVWQRDFEHGRVLVNPSRRAVSIDLGSEFRRICGTLERTWNDGSRVHVLMLPPRSGTILLNPLASMPIAESPDCA